ncbi:hypothetical protein G7092_15195 [Mucilaginibacter sp. HC2]|uniref:fasciclin domain-containing protein n=1 Tax=Mucilaginibacter inviolabilis TaxID=2714892 RepID=UPI00140B6E80|nr:fasciclin domain-containing protein [Mucilaginibacter inviolabilis]NHA05154.1 hypothetical protein [Mucilaginibacter inviolabilis]
MKYQHIYNQIRSKMGSLLLMLCISALWLSCKKNEEPPIPVGKPIKYSGQMLGSIDSALQKSPYTLFYAAWKQGGLDSLVAAVKPSSLTIYAPTDSAFTAAGYTMSRIKSTSKPILDSLLLFHIGLGTYVDSTLTTLNGTTEVTTLLQSANPPQSVPPSFPFNAGTPYIYSLFVSPNNGFWINGKQVKTRQKNITAFHAIIYPINQVLQKPDKDIYAILNSDPRFSYLMASYRMSDSLVIANIGFLIKSDTTNLYLSPNFSNVTLFAPTNDVFIKFLAGVYHKNTSAVTLDDLRNYQNRTTGQIDFNELSPIDTLISCYNVNYGFGRNSSSTRPLVTGSTWLYNDLLYNAASLSGYVVSPARSGGYPAVIVDLDFPHTGNQVQVKRHTSNTSPPVNITQHDIMATNGVIHIVDGILQP